nr:mitochondrial import receptor subunit TOM7 homolog [Dromaius novaehollandiae]
MGLSPPPDRRGLGARPQLLVQGCNASGAPPLSLAAGMPKLSKEAKQRLQQLFKGGQFAIRWGFIPVVLYLGFRRGADPGMPEPTILSLLWG